MLKAISDKKQKLIDAKNASPLTFGEEISVKYNAVNSYFDKERENRTVKCMIIKILKNKIVVKHVDGSINEPNYTIQKEDIVGRETLYIGENPFDEKFDSIKAVNFTLESILFNLNILGEKNNDKYNIKNVPITELNWNPFIFLKDGTKQYYQRPFVWTIADKQLLIESIYNGIDCGKILVRLRSWKELGQMQSKGETELSFRDIIDGKQRLNTIKEFMNNEFPDSFGNTYGDLSHYSQYKFTNHQLFSYAEMPENSKDDDVLHQFLKLNFTGIPQSKEHIDFVKSLKSKF